MSGQEEEQHPLLADDSFKKAAIAKPHMPRQNPCLWCFHLLEGFATIVSLCLLVTQVLPLFYVRFSDFAGQIDFLSLALKVYISFFCLFFIATELGLPLPPVQASPMLQNYTSRGVLYSFLGLICVQEAYSERVKDMVDHRDDAYFHVGWAAIFMQITSWLMLGVGVVYILLGVCCLKRLRDRMEQDEKVTWANYRQGIAEWKTKYGE
jgi:hypothetical protein